MKKALVIGINDYKTPDNHLNGCVNDAKEISRLLTKHEDGTPNFDCQTLTSGPNKETITNYVLESKINDLFSGDPEMALLYFSGHGCSDNTGTHLVAQDETKFNMSNIVTLIEDSKAKECIVLLDCCFSGGAGRLPQLNIDHIREGVSILAACKNDQVSMESEGMGLFTSLVCDALRGSASDLLGMITATSVYAHVEPIFNAWEQRPLFKTHVSKPTTLRMCKPHIDLEILRSLAMIFPEVDSIRHLDKSYEPTESKPNSNHKIFECLQKYRALGLIKLNKEDHIYYEAINNGGCSLTPLGKFYCRLVKADRI